MILNQATALALVVKASWQPPPPSLCMHFSQLSLSNAIEKGCSIGISKTCRSIAETQSNFDDLFCN